MTPEGRIRREEEFENRGDEPLPMTPERRARGNNLDLNKFVKQSGYFQTTRATRNRFPPSIFAISSLR